MDSPRDGPNPKTRSAWNSPELASLMEKLFAAKRARRAALVRLPFEEKVRIIVELQKMAFEIRSAAGASAPNPWDLSQWVSRTVRSRRFRCACIGVCW